MRWSQDTETKRPIYIMSGITSEYPSDSSSEAEIVLIFLEDITDYSVGVASLSNIVRYLSAAMQHAHVIT
jgi:hypothetical protein